MKFASLLSVFILLPATALGAEPTATAFGELFCKASLSDDMTPIEAAMTPSLALVIAEADAKNAEIDAAFTDEKPPLGDGLPWRSWQDYADGCEVGDISEADGTTTVEIRYTFSTEPDANYADTLVLKRSADAENAWRLDDIELIANRTMRSSLAEAFAP